MTAYWVGDVPAEDLVVSPARAPEDYIDLEPFDDVDLELRAPDGTLVPSAGELVGTLVTVDDEKLVDIEWPTTSPFYMGGIYSLNITVLGTGSIQQRLAPVRLIIQDDDGWYSLEEARADWDGAPNDDALLYRVLHMGKRDVIGYDDGRLLETIDSRPPLSLRDAQLAQARNTWNAALVDPQGVIGEGSLAISPFPLDWKIKQMIRPQRAKKWGG